MVRNLYRDFYLGPPQLDFTMKYPLRNLGYARDQGKDSRGNTSSLTLSQFRNSVLEKVKDLMHVTLA